MSGLGASLRLPTPFADYDQIREAERNRAIERADTQNHKRGRDVEIGASGERLILTDSNGTRYAVKATTDGVLTMTIIKEAGVAFDTGFSVGFG